MFGALHPWVHLSFILYVAEPLSDNIGLIYLVSQIYKGVNMKRVTLRDLQLMIKISERCFCMAAQLLPDSSYVDLQLHSVAKQCYCINKQDL